MIIPIKLSTIEQKYLERIEQELKVCGCSLRVYNLNCLNCHKTILLSREEYSTVVALQYFIACQYEYFCSSIEGYRSSEQQHASHSDLNLFLPYIRKNTF